MRAKLHRWAAADPGRRFDDLFNFVHDPAIRAAGRFALCVQDDSLPCRHASVEGPVDSEEELDRAERAAMAAAT
jgi:hypothetical protein